MIVECMAAACAWAFVHPPHFHPAPPPRPAPAVSPPDPATVPAGSVWDRLADCESGGEWHYDPATATWGSRHFEGGLQFEPSTWDAYRPDGFPDAAHAATPAQQIAVAERVLSEQGWGAWPHCSRQMGLR